MFSLLNTYSITYCIIYAQIYNEEKRKLGESKLGNKVVAVIGAQARPDRRNREQFRDHAYRADGGTPGRTTGPDDRREVVR